MSFLQKIEADLQELWQRLTDDEHPAATKVEGILSDVKAEAEKTGDEIKADVEPAVETAETDAEHGAENAAETAAADVQHDV